MHSYKEWQGTHGQQVHNKIKMLRTCEVHWDLSDVMVCYIGNADGERTPASHTMHGGWAKYDTYTHAKQSTRSMTFLSVEYNRAS